MGPPGGGRSNITGRFSRHLNIVSIDKFDDNTLTSIFTSIVDWHFAKGFDATFQRLGKVKSVIMYIDMNVRLRTSMSEYWHIYVIYQLRGPYWKQKLPEVSETSRGHRIEIDITGGGKNLGWGSFFTGLKLVCFFTWASFKVSVKRKFLFDIFVDKGLKFRFLLLKLNIAPF